MNKQFFIIIVATVFHTLILRAEGTMSQPTASSAEKFETVGSRFIAKTFSASIKVGEKTKKTDKEGFKKQLSEKDAAFMNLVMKGSPEHGIEPFAKQMQSSSSQWKNTEAQPDVIKGMAHYMRSLAKQGNMSVPPVLEKDESTTTTEQYLEGLTELEQQFAKRYEKIEEKQQPSYFPNEWTVLIGPNLVKVGAVMAGHCYTKAAMANSITERIADANHAVHTGNIATAKALIAPHPNTGPSVWGHSKTSLAVEAISLSMDKVSALQAKAYEKKIIDELIKQDMHEKNRTISRDALKGTHLPTATVDTLEQYTGKLNQPIFKYFHTLDDENRNKSSILFFGGPGTGKTLTAKAIAAKHDSSFFTLPAGIFTSANAEQRLKEFITMVDEYVTIHKKNGAVILIDEIDCAAMGGARGMVCFFDGLHGFGNPAHHKLFLAATNRPEELDRALLRPGRFDDAIIFDIPSEDMRKQLLQSECPHLAKDTVDFLAVKTKAFSQADMTNLHQRAHISAIAEKEGVTTAKHYCDAIDEMKREKSMIAAQKNSRDQAQQALLQGLRG